MRYRINQIKTDIEESKDSLPGAIAKSLGRKNLDVSDVRIVKESVDARRKPDIKLVYTLDFSCSETLDLAKAECKRYEEIKIPEDTVEKTLKKHGRPVIIGFGPAGMFAALILAEAGLRPVVIERGEDVDRRIKSVENFWSCGNLDENSNVQFGEGGAGTFSDGKLTTGIKDIRISKVMEEFVEAGADESIAYKNKPHIGTDRLREIVKNIRLKIESLGGEVRFCEKVSEIKKKTEAGKEKIIGVFTEGTCGRSFSDEIDSECVIAATGHSAYDTVKMLFENGVEMSQKPFSIGVRIQHPQKIINIAQYGSEKAAEIIGPAEYKLNCRTSGGRGVYTFCMCPGGEVIDSSSEKNTAVTNGMSMSGRNGKYANSGLLADVRTDDFPSKHPLAGFDFQRKYERLAYVMGGGSLPQSCFGDFARNEEDPVRKSLPVFAADAIIEAMPVFGKKLKGFDREDAKMTAVESRSSSPVRIERDESGQSCIRGLFPSGEGAGYAGGIVSAAVDGIKTAEKTIKVIFS